MSRPISLLQTIVIDNALFRTVLGIMLISAFVFMYANLTGLKAISGLAQQVKAREFRYLGLVRWKLSKMVATLPFLVQMSLPSFAIGLVIFFSTLAGHPVGLLWESLVLVLSASISIFITSSSSRSALADFRRFVLACACIIMSGGGRIPS